MRFPIKVTSCGKGKNPAARIESSRVYETHVTADMTTTIFSIIMHEAIRRCGVIMLLKLLDGDRRLRSIATRCGVTLNPN